jgi:hypothetical protein
MNMVITGSNHIFAGLESAKNTTFNLKKTATQGGGGERAAARDSKAFAKDDS